MSNVKTGDMAYLIAPHQGANTFVEVLQHATAYNITAAGWPSHTIAWECKISAGLRGVHPASRKPMYFLPGDVVVLQDKYLRPVPPKHDPLYDVDQIYPDIRELDKAHASITSTTTPL